MLLTLILLLMASCMYPGSSLLLRAPSFRSSRSCYTASTARIRASSDDANDVWQRTESTQQHAASSSGKNALDDGYATVTPPPTTTTTARIRRLLTRVERILEQQDAYFVNPNAIQARISALHQHDTQSTASNTKVGKNAIRNVNHFAVEGEDARVCEIADDVTPIQFRDVLVHQDDENDDQDQGYRLAIQTTSTPLLSKDEINVIQDAANAYFQKQQQQNDDPSTTTTTANSRFTYQRPGNSEAHVSDLGPHVKEIVDSMLQNRLYPLIRRSNLLLLETTTTASAISVSSSPTTTDEFKLCVYDALFIRYNATDAARLAANSQSSPNFEPNCDMAPEMSMTTSNVGAGQPLHRDLGLVSANIMLNEACEFQGGGTFFENQMRSTTATSSSTTGSLKRKHNDSIACLPAIEPLKPMGLGHALVHASSERHAGAVTTSGVRDILVVFSTAQTPSSSSMDDMEEDQEDDTTLPPPPAIQSALLKQCRVHCDQLCSNSSPLNAAFSNILCRVAHQFSAVRGNQHDGEALQYLGTALFDYYGALESDAQQNTPLGQRWHVLETSRQCLECASVLTPCDSRVYNNLGLVLTKIADGNVKEAEEPAHQQAENAFQRSLALLRQSETAKCDVQDELELVTRNYGLCLANQDRFAEACKVLEPIATRYQRMSASASGGQVHADIYSLWSFCESQLRIK